MQEADYVNKSSDTRSVIKPVLLLGALGAAALLLLTIIGAPGASAAPATQHGWLPLAQAGAGSGKGQDPSANSVAQYLESKGYTVDDVGYLQDNSGKVNTDEVAVVMDFASTSYDPNSGLPTADQDTVTQVVQGFYALHKNYPKSSVIVVALAYQNNYLFVFPTKAADWQQVLDNANDSTIANNFWQTVSSNFTILDANGNVVDPSSFGNKNFGGGDFTGQNGNNGPTPPTNNPTNNPVDPASGHSAGAGYLRLIPSSAYLPSSGGSFYLIGAISDKDFNPAAGQKVAFSVSTTGQKEQRINSVQQTDNNGTARVQVSGINAGNRENQATVKAICAASNDPTSCGDVTVDGPASAVIVIGPGNLSSDNGKQALNDALAAQGYSMEGVDYQESQGVTGDTIAYGAVAMDMASQRFDQTLRSQMFSGFGTIFTVFPKAKSGIEAMVYATGGKVYELIYQVNRTDWQSYVQGQTDEPTFWKQVMLVEVDDAKTGQKIDGNGKDFVDKNFSGSSSTGSTGGLVHQRQVESTLTVEDWGPQPTDDNIIVPLGGFADSFTVLSATGSEGKAWSIYSVEDTSKPVYQAKNDPNGATLKSLTLQEGNYILMVEDPNPPDGTATGTVVEDIKLQYSEHLP